MNESLLANATCVSIGGRGVLIEGPPGSGKSTLALALIDRGATLVGDDGVALAREGERLWGHPPPNIPGLLEIRGVGLVTVPTTSAPLCLVLELAEQGERLPTIATWTRAGVTLPALAFTPTASAALRAEWALREHGLGFPLPKPDAG